MRRAFAGPVAAALLAGCGPGAAHEANRYADAVNRAQSRFERTVNSLSGRIGTTSDLAGDRRVLRNFDAAVGRVVGELRAIKPPARVASLHERLVGQIDGYGRLIRAESEALQSGDARRLVAAQQRLLAATRSVSAKLNTTIQAINRRLQST
jgi:hypothetical protein